jgi:hypothetical protein
MSTLSAVQGGAAPALAVRPAGQAGVGQVRITRAPTAGPAAVVQLSEAARRTLGQGVPSVQPPKVLMGSALNPMSPRQIGGARYVEQAAQQLVEPTILTRVGEGEVQLGQWNSGSYAQMRSNRPGLNIHLDGEKQRTAQTLSARLSRGEQPLEVGAGRHLVRPDGRGTG